MRVGMKTVGQGNRENKSEDGIRIKPVNNLADILALKPGEVISGPHDERLHYSGTDYRFPDGKGAAEVVFFSITDATGRIFRNSIEAHWLNFNSELKFKDGKLTRDAMQGCTIRWRDFDTPGYEECSKQVYG